jgi:hypothetical protein
MEHPFMHETAFFSEIYPPRLKPIPSKEKKAPEGRHNQAQDLCRPCGASV